MRRLLLGFVFLLTIADSCNNGVVGVQDYGQVTGRVLDAMTNRPIANAIVSVGSLFTATADANGAFILPHIPIGQQTVSARMPGFSTDSAPVRVRKGETSQAGYLRLVPITKPASVPTLPPPPTPTPEASAVPTYNPEAQPSSPAASPAAPSMTPSAQP
ncbi:MAG: carboxypeptidase regulatory-like domain-containing protein [Candidatus Eremiobacteraeota bacterium]|nr:carboxypeptidase regulatory-like domain-containing protein [Candidatus Eremiobacteraeota bacterium]